jgi:four helix bundle protein
MNDKTEILKKRLFDFSVDIVYLYVRLKEKHEYAISSQLVRSATSIGANFEEACAAQSRADFISKTSISSKEARETLYWLRILNETKIINANLEKHMKEADEIVRIFTALVRSAQSNARKS